MRWKPVSWEASQKARMLDACSSFLSLLRGKPQLRNFLLNITALCQGSRGSSPSKMQQPFLFTLIHYSSWFCVHLECCDLLTGFRNSQKRNFVHMLISYYPLGRNVSLGFLSLPSCWPHFNLDFLVWIFAAIWQVCLWIESCGCVGFALYSSNTLNLKEVTLSAVRE